MGDSMGNEYCTVKLPKGLLEKVKMVVESDDSYLNASDYVRYAVRRLLNELSISKSKPDNDGGN